MRDNIPALGLRLFHFFILFYFIFSRNEPRLISGCFITLIVGFYIILNLRYKHTFPHKVSAHPLTQRL
jgi:hypothetical protein